MGKLLVLSLSFASAMATAAPLQEQENAHLTAAQVRDPQLVARWLAEHGSTVDQKKAGWFFELGVREKKNRNWSAASKAFGESMIRYPSPRPLVEYVDADLRMLGQLRMREGASRSVIVDDINYALGFYEASLAADDVLKTLSSKERNGISRNISCLRQYASSGSGQLDCQPLRYFFANL